MTGTKISFTMIDSVIIFDGTSYFVESLDYEVQDDEEVVFKGEFGPCNVKCEALNGEIIVRGAYA